jgi:hypothetical protein
VELVSCSFSGGASQAAVGILRACYVSWLHRGLSSIAIGMNLWCSPQISEHCPYRMPGRLIENLAWFRRPGVASVAPGFEFHSNPGAVN